MISTSVTAGVPFTPSWLRDRPHKPVYMLRAGSVLERELLEAELASEYRADRVMSYDLDGAARAGVRAIASPDVAAHIIGLLDAEAAATDEGQALDPTDIQTLAEARRVLSEHWPEYKMLVAQIARRNTITPVIAFQRFCVEWRGRDAVFAVDQFGRITDDALASVPSFELRSAGFEAYRMLYAGGAEKNSVAPSSSSDDRKISPAAAGSKAAGKLLAKRGTKTPA